MKITIKRSAPKQAKNLVANAKAGLIAMSETLKQKPENRKSINNHL